MQPTPPSMAARERIEALILERGLAPGSRLPTERELSDLWGISRSTIRVAIRRLVSEGTLVSQQGAGNFLAPPKVTRNLRDLQPFAVAAAAAGRALRTVCLRCDEIIPSASVADLLEIDMTTPVVEIVRLRLLDDEPASVETSRLSAARFQGLGDVDFTEWSLYRVLDERFGTRVDHGHERLGVESTPDDVARALDIPAGTAIFRVRGVARDTEDHPVEQFDSWARPEMIRFATTLNAEGAS